MDYRTATRKDGSDREEQGTGINSIFWKRLLNTQEGSRDLNIVLEGGGQKHCDPHTYTPLHRIVILPMFPGVLSTHWHINTHAHIRT